MNEEVERLRQQVQDLAGRFIADAALLRQTVLGHSTPQIRATLAQVEKLSEDPTVKLLLRAMPHASLKAFDEERKGWLTLLQQEIASRNTDSNM